MQSSFVCAESGEAPKCEGGWGGGVHDTSHDNFYSPVELQALMAQAVPVDVVTSPKFEGALPAMACAVPVAQAVPVLTTAVGMPIYSAQTRSVVRTEQDGASGVKSCDESLQSADEILNFLNTYNTRPKVACHVHGYHRERRHRNVTRTDSEGNKTTHREEYCKLQQKCQLLVFLLKMRR